jgi:hypothetical protein
MELAVRLRDEPADAVARELDGLDVTELRDVAILAAACINVDRPISELVWWTQLDRFPMRDRRRVRRMELDGGSPCGTAPAYRRHVARGELVDVACEVGYRREEMDRKRLEYGRRPAAVPDLPSDQLAA